MKKLIIEMAQEWLDRELSDGSVGLGPYIDALRNFKHEGKNARELGEHFGRVKEHPSFGKQITFTIKELQQLIDFVRQDWPADDSRIDAIGQNGNTGEHYKL